MIAIELETTGWLHGWFKGKAPSFYIYNLLARQPFPLLLGYCQYEPNVLKFTPPLSITSDEIEQVSETIAAALRLPPYKLLLPALGALATTSLRSKWRSH